MSTDRRSFLALLVGSPAAAAVLPPAPLARSVAGLRPWIPLPGPDADWMDVELFSALVRVEAEQIEGADLSGYNLWRTPGSGQIVFRAHFDEDEGAALYLKFWRPSQPDCGLNCFGAFGATHDFQLFELRMRRGRDGTTRCVQVVPWGLS